MNKLAEEIRDMWHQVRVQIMTITDGKETT